MALSRECADRRRTNKDLKTQIRFGKRDIELFTKEKGKGEAFKKVDLGDFMDTKNLPPYNHKISWKIHAEKKFRKKG